MLKPGEKIELSKVEEEVLKRWAERQIFEKSVEHRKRNKSFSFYDGPPFATGLPHYGHILATTIKDSVTRFWTMRETVKRMQAKGWREFYTGETARRLVSELSPAIVRGISWALRRTLGVGGAVGEKLARLGIFTVQDLLFHLPSRYQDRTRLTPLGALRLQQEVVVDPAVALRARGAEVETGRFGAQMEVASVNDGCGWCRSPFRKVPPRDATDCHVHVFDPARFRYAAHRRFTPPAPRSLLSNSSTTSKPTCSTGTTIICASRSIGLMVKVSRPRFQVDTNSWPW